MTGCISYHNPHREENRHGPQIISEEPQICTAVDSGDLVNFQVGFMVILYVRISLVNR